MASFTAGPWTGYAGDGVLDSQGRRIASLSWGGKRITRQLNEGEALANARLIAKAPELYAALKRLLEATARIDGYEDLLIDPEHEATMVLAAIDGEGYPTGAKAQYGRA